jgi:hypothetical protein
MNLTEVQGIIVLQCSFCVGLVHITETTVVCIQPDDSVGRVVRNFELINAAPRSRCLVL